MPIQQEMDVHGMIVSVKSQLILTTLMCLNGFEDCKNETYEFNNIIKFIILLNS